MILEVKTSHGSEKATWARWTYGDGSSVTITVLPMPFEQAKERLLVQYKPLYARLFYRIKEMFR